MRSILSFLIIFAVHCSLANEKFSESRPVTFKSDALKKALGLKDYNVSDLDIARVLASNETVTNAPRECAAVVYKLYGTVSRHSDKRVANLYDFHEPLPTRETLLESKGYLQMAGMYHTNETVRSYAFITLAAGFYGDEELGEWIAEQYFFPLESVHPDVFYLGVIGIGGFTGESAKLCIKDAIHSQDRVKVLGTIQCIVDNPDVYNDFLSDLIVAARKAHITFEGLGYVRSYRDLIRALRTYGKEVGLYKKHLELMRDNCSDNLSCHHIDIYINSLEKEEEGLSPINKGFVREKLEERNGIF